MGVVEMAELTQLLTLSRTDRSVSGVVEETLADSHRSNHGRGVPSLPMSFPFSVIKEVGARED